MFKDVFNLLQSKLKPIKEIKLIEWYINQEKKVDGILNTPAVFINLKPARIKELSKSTEEVTLEFDVIIFTENLKDINKLADDYNIHFLVEEEIQINLKCYEKIGFSPIEKTPSGLHRSSISYQMHFNQSTSLAKNRTKKTTAVIANVTTEIP
jgi:hypothetical protein